MKNFLDINLATLNKYITIDGVATRTEYWYFVLFTWLIDLGSNIADLFIPGDYIANIMTVLLFMPAVTVAIRRMHDTDHAGWWLLVPFVNFIFLITPSKPSRWQPTD